MAKNKNKIIQNQTMTTTPTHTEIIQNFLNKNKFKVIKTTSFPENEGTDIISFEDKEEMIFDWIIEKADKNFVCIACTHVIPIKENADKSKLFELCLEISADIKTVKVIPQDDHLSFFSQSAIPNPTDFKYVFFNAMNCLMLAFGHTIELATENPKYKDLVDVNFDDCCDKCDKEECESCSENKPKTDKQLN